MLVDVSFRDGASDPRSAPRSLRGRGPSRPSTTLGCRRCPHRTDGGWRRPRSRIRPGSPRRAPSRSRRTGSGTRRARPPPPRAWPGRGRRRAGFRGALGVGTAIFAGSAGSSSSGGWSAAAASTGVAAGVGARRPAPRQELRVSAMPPSRRRWWRCWSRRSRWPLGWSDSVGASAVSTAVSSEAGSAWASVAQGRRKPDRCSAVAMCSSSRLRPGNRPGSGGAVIFRAGGARAQQVSRTVRRSPEVPVRSGLAGSGPDGSRGSPANRDRRCRRSIATCNPPRPRPVPLPRAPSTAGRACSTRAGERCAISASRSRIAATSAAPTACRPRSSGATTRSCRTRRS